MAKRNLLVVWITVIYALILIFTASSIYAYHSGKRETAEDFVNALYTFKLSEVVNNDKRIKEIASEEIYNAYTLSSSNRQLRVYLKFQGNPTEAKIISHKDNTIYFNIKSPGFDEERIFAIHYEYSWGKIVKAAEYEVFLLPQTLEEDLK